MIVLSTLKRGRKGMLSCKHYFDIGFMSSSHIVFKQKLPNEMDHKHTKFIFHIMIGDWEKEIVVWKRNKDFRK